MDLEFVKKLPIPMEIKEQYPVPESAREAKARCDRALRDVFEGRDARFVLIIGPCSADAEEPVMTYLERLVPVAERVRDKILIVPRIYTNKPRTTGDGYKGMLHQPEPTAKPDLLGGLVAIRRLHIRALSETGFGCADEMLYPENHRLLDDLLCYVAVGARSVENQQHRLTASGLGIPVGMKNPTGGDLSVMMNAIHAAQHGHTFIYRGWEAVSHGNPMAHAILRGYVDRLGHTHANYHYEDLANLAALYADSRLEHPAVVVDTNHANSGKKWEEQPRIASEILHSRRANPDVARLVKGLMIESYLVDGAQKVGGGVFGQSITDPCLGWEKTERLIYDIADKL